MRVLVSILLGTLIALPSLASAQQQAAENRPGREVIPVPVANADFEEGAQPTGWQCPPNGDIVEENPGHGKRCARLTVSSAEEKGVYITQRVPIEPGARYQANAMIRTEGVKPASVLGMSTVGAALIVEWADKDGKWLAAGEYSNEPGFGTHPWKRCSCDNLLAPPKAGYAIIFLALRGTGTAWFDDVHFTEVRRTIVLQSPQDGIEIRNNRPRLEWTEETDALEYEIELSRDPAFPEGGARYEARTSDPFFVPSGPLAQGTWHWRVRMADGRWSKPRRFSQTAPPDADTTGPRIAPIEQSITQPDQPLRVRLSDPSGVKAEGVRVKGIEGKSFKAEQEKDAVAIRADGGWPRGAHKIEVAATDNLGNEAREEFWVAVAPAPPKPLRWDCQRGVFDGEKYIFPVGIYQVKEEDYAKVKAAGFTLVHQYTWEGSQDDAKAREYLDGVQKGGLTAFVGFDRGGWGKKNGLVQGNREHVARRIAALRDHPALFAWYLFDEPDLAHQFVAPRNLRAWYRFIKALDPFHPVIVTLACKNSITKYGQGCYDVYWTMAYRDTAYVADLIEEHQRELGPGRPHMIILHSYDHEQTTRIKSGEKTDDAAFQPDLALFRANAYMALAHGSSGLCWWWYGDGRRRFLSVGDVPQAWGWLSKVVGEVRELIPMLTAEGEVLPIQAKSDPEDAKIRIWAKKTGAGITVIAVNPDSKGEATATIHSAGLPDNATASVRFENREVTVAGRQLTDRFGPMAAHVYEVKLGR